MCMFIKNHVWWTYLQKYDFLISQIFSKNFIGDLMLNHRNSALRPTQTPSNSMNWWKKWCSDKFQSLKKLHNENTISKHVLTWLDHTLIMSTWNGNLFKNTMFLMPHRL